MMVLTGALFYVFPAASFTIDVKTDRPEAIYRCGEQATFSIAFMGVDPLDKTGEAWATLSLDGLKVIKKTKISPPSGVTSISGTLHEPGFLRCKVQYVTRTHTYTGMAAAGFEPEKIKAVTRMPPDFDKFWHDGMQELEKIPLDPILTPLPEHSSASQNAFKISFANIDDTRIYGYLNIPTKEADWVHEPKIPGNPLVLKKKLYPALVSVPGAGVGSPKNPIISDKMITLFMSVHDHDLGLPNEVYEALEKGRLKGHYYQGAPDKYRYYFRRAILGVNRAINYLATRPEFDGKHLVFSGGSQGGFFALMMAGLNNNITGAVAMVPGFGDQAGYLAGRMPGSPKLVLAAPESEKEEWLKMSAYYDTVNFAKKIKCPTLVYVGFIDPACPPGSVYAAFNEIKSPKRIINGILMGHGGRTPELLKFKEKWVEEQLGFSDVINNNG